MKHLTSASTLASLLGITSENAPTYSLWKPVGHALGIVILQTDNTGSQTWVSSIHDDNLFAEAAAFLEENGAPSFPTVQKQNDYVREFEKGLQSGLPVVKARDKALGIVDTVDYGSQSAEQQI